MGCTRTVCFQICIDYLLSVLSWLLLSIGLPPPANVMAKAETCNAVTLQWDQPSEPNNITTSVSCTPPSSGCAECTTSPCYITGLNPSTEYEFTVTLKIDSVVCGTSMNTTGTRTRGEIKCVKQWKYSSRQLFQIKLPNMPSIILTFSQD